uniref:Uncharacterized protein n=1 Tax=Plectus sambesii TaxID=2011161 RepID=A0A914VTB2_9BILA
MSSQNVAIALLLLVAIAAAAPQGGLIPGPPSKTIATAGESNGNSTGQLVGCAALPTQSQCILCKCVWQNTQCVGSTSIC